MVSVVMEDLSSTRDVVSRFTQTLAAIDVNILISGQGSRSVSCVVLDCETQTAVSATHMAFNFSHQVVPLLVVAPSAGQDPSWSTVAKALIEMIHQQAPSMQQDLQVDLRIVGVVRPGGRQVINTAGLSQDEIDEVMANTASVASTPSKGGVQAQVSRAVDVLDDTVLDQLTGQGAPPSLTLTPIANPNPHS